MTKSPCLFCEKGIGTTADHVPPRCFFASPFPPNLLTVPCCESCRQSDQSNDQMIRNLFTSLHNTENHPLVKSELAMRRNKAMRDQPTKAMALMHIITPQEVRSPGGLYLGHAPAFNLDDPRVDRFLERVCRAVLFDSCNKGFFSGTFSWKILPSEVVPNLFQSAPKECPQRNFGDIFSYVVLAKEGIVLLRFYEGFAAAGTFTPTIDFTGAK